MVFRLLLLFTSLFGICNHVNSQDYIFNRFSTQDGLLSNNILAVWQDTSGYLWLGSETGLQRYDGSLFRTISDARVDQLFSDKKGRAWIRSGKKVFKFNPTAFSFTEIPFKKSAANTDLPSIRLDKDASGNVYVIVDGKSCQYFDEASKIFDSKYTPFSIPDSIPVLSVAEDIVRQRYWIISEKMEGYWDKKTKNFVSVHSDDSKDLLLNSGKLPPKISNFFIDNSNHYWIAGWNGGDRKFLCYDAANNKFTSDTTGLAGAGNGGYFDVFGFMQYDDTTVAVYGLNCLRIKENGVFHELRDPRSHPYTLQFNICSAVFQDRERMVWLATDNGLYNTKGNLRRSIHVIFKNDYAKGSVSSVIEDEKQQLWMGNWGRGVFLMNTKEGTYPVVTMPTQFSFKDEFTKLVWSLCEDRRNRKIWFGCQEGRLMIYDTKTEKVNLYRPPVFENSTVRQLFKDKNGSLWIGLQNGILLKFENSNSQFNENSFRKVFSFPDFITKINEDRNNLVWIAVNGKGIYLFDLANEKIIQTFDRESSGTELITTVKDIVSINDSLYLLAAEKTAILNVKTGQVNELPFKNSLTIGYTYALQKDTHGNCWIGSSNGLFKFNPTTNSLTKYSQRDGLISIHNNSYIPETSLHMNDNRLVFGGNQHLLVFDPEDYRSSKSPPDITITGFQLNSRYLPADSLQRLDVIRIPYQSNSFSIDFAALSFAEAERLEYEYKLEGIDENWNAVNKVAAVKYNLLPHGQYRFLVRAKNDEGMFSAKTTSLSIYIVPPFWKTIWFYCLIALIVIAIFFFLHRLRLQRLLHVEKVRSRLARDLHDDMGSTLSTVNILSNLALRQTPLDEKTSKEYMATINTSTTQMMEAMDDIVWSINPVNDSMVKMLARMKEVAGALLEPQQVEYHFQADNAVMTLHFDMEARREIFLVFKEALNNIVKYASCTNVVFVLQKKGNGFLLKIEDNGKGFDSTIQSSSTRGNGLKNMKKRAENINGTISITSAPGIGTQVSLFISLA